MDGVEGSGQGRGGDGGIGKRGRAGRRQTGCGHINGYYDRGQEGVLLL